MNSLVLLLLSCALFMLGLGGAPFETYSHEAIGIITFTECYQRPDGNYVCDLKFSYNLTQFTLLHQVPLKVVSRTNYQFGQTVTIFYNPRDPNTISLSKYVPSNRVNLFFVVMAMSIFLLLSKKT
jgi:hypothetical protein